MDKLCKGQDEKGNWHYGYFIKLNEYTPYPINSQPVPYKCYLAIEKSNDWGLPTELKIIPIKEETVCQYIGYNDIHNRKIFENDVILSNNIKYKVIYDNNSLSWKFVPLDEKLEEYTRDKIMKVEIIDE